jgi:hypothetical protein
MKTNLSIPSTPADIYEYFSEQAKGTNINSRTLLATDYLNHFNEIIMIIDMISDMMECLGEVTAWRPISYVDHFQDSGFSYSDLAIAAYAHVPSNYKQAFESTIAELNQKILEVVEKLARAAGSGDNAAIERIAQFTPELRALLEKAGGIINGGATGTDQHDIDDMLNN